MEEGELAFGPVGAAKRRGVEIDNRRRKRTRIATWSSDGLLDVDEEGTVG